METTSSFLLVETSWHKEATSDVGDNTDTGENRLPKGVTIGGSRPEVSDYKQTQANKHYA